MAGARRLSSLPFSNSLFSFYSALILIVTYFLSFHFFTFWCIHSHPNTHHALHSNSRAPILQRLLLSSPAHCCSINPFINSFPLLYLTGVSTFATFILAPAPPLPS